nr:MAG TPA: hypothetical protein [Bacteriophage sp.]
MHVFWYSRLCFWPICLSSTDRKLPKTGCKQRKSIV